LIREQDDVYCGGGVVCARGIKCSGIEGQKKRNSVAELGKFFFGKEVMKMHSKLEGRIHSI